MAGPVFRASYPGECADCFADFDEGDEVRFNDDGQLVAQDCCGHEYDVDFEP